MKMFVVCTHALCTLHARIVQTARTHCARCTHALCTLHARIVHAARTHCGHCTHALCTLHARTVHAAFDTLWIAILGFMTLVLLADTEREPLLEHVERDTLLFFAALFVLMHFSCTSRKAWAH